MHKVIQTKSLNKCFRTLLKHGKKGKDAVTKVRAALSEAASEGEIKNLQRTKNGETRLKDVEKYDLGSGYRLVVQLVEEESNVRAFLYAGDHDDTQLWLDSHKDYKWIKSDKDQTLEFVQVSEEEPREPRFVDPDFESAEELRRLPLLRHIEDKSWKALHLSAETKEYILSINTEKWECDPNGILEHIEEMSSIDNAIIFDDLFCHAHKGELSELAKRIKLEIGQAEVTVGPELADAMSSPINSEIFVTWEESNSLPDNSSWADWLLFLHPEQKAISVKDFKGPSRLRGVSGSGKTCVMLHRARFLAKKYKKPILLVTLTESMRKLLDALIKELCGVESSYIETATINRLAQNIVKSLHPKKEAAFMIADHRINGDLNDKVYNFVRGHQKFSSTKLSNLDYITQKKFIEEEVYYIRSRLKSSEFDKYLDTKSFKRHGRKRALSQDGRVVFLEAARYRSSELQKLFKLDYEAIVSSAASLLSNDQDSLSSFGWSKIDNEALEKNINSYTPFRCILIDEVQDLSQLEISMIGSLQTTDSKKISESEDGLFLVGDGAQTIYNKGFVLKDCDINVSNRSYVLKKNYRNSKEIMAAAYALIENYEFADVDEDNIASPTEPDLAAKTGEKPFIIKCRDSNSELEFITNKIKILISEHQDLHDTQTYPEICIIGLNSKTRRDLSTKLKNNSIKSRELREHSDIDGNGSVAISTIESAKGHEFKHVFIVGVNENIIPPRYSNDNDLSREASRLYVAMTRAQETLYISYTVDDGKQPSRFLINFQSLCNEYDWRNNELDLIE